jgi:hypothetical protein
VGVVVGWDLEVENKRACTSGECARAGWDAGGCAGWLGILLGVLLGVVGAYVR